MKKLLALSLFSGLFFGLVSFVYSQPISGPAGLFIFVGDSIDNLGDVDTDGKADGACFVYNGSTEKWEASVCPGGGSGASSLELAVGGVQVTSPTASINLSSHVFTASQSPSGTANIALVGSSVTLQGNSFNAANLLLQLNGSGLIPNELIDGSSVTKLGNSIALETETTGDYVESLLAGLGISVSGSGEASNVTVSFDPVELTGSHTFADGTTGTVTWAWGVIGTDPSFSFSNNQITTPNNVTIGGNVSIGVGKELTVSGKKVCLEDGTDCSFSGQEANLATFEDGIQISSPTGGLNFLDPIKVSLQGSTSAQISLDPDFVANATPLGVTTGTVSGFAHVESTGTLYLVFDADLFTAALQDGNTAFVSLAEEYLTTSSAAATYLQEVLIDDLPNHGFSHADGEVDEIDVDGLSGLLDDPQYVAITTGTTLLGNTTHLAFVAGSNVTIEGDAHASSTTITISASGGGSGSSPFDEATSTTNLSMGGFDLTDIGEISGSTFSFSSGTVAGELRAETIIGLGTLSDDTIFPASGSTGDYLVQSSALGSVGWGPLQLASLTSRPCLGTNSSGTIIEGTCIENTDTLQSGATFYVSSGTVTGDLYLRGTNGTFTKDQEGASPPYSRERLVHVKENVGGGSYRIIVSTRSTFGLPSAAGYTSLQIQAPTASVDGSIFYYIDGATRLTVSETGVTAGVDLSVPDEAYGSGWNGSVEVPTKNAVYDKIETISGGSADNLGNHTATETLKMAGFEITQVSTISAQTGRETIEISTSVNVSGEITGTGELNISQAGNSAFIFAPSNSVPTAILRDNSGFGGKLLFDNTDDGRQMSIDVDSANSELDISTKTSVPALKITGLTSEDCIGTDASGNVQAGTCGGGSGGGYNLEPATVTPSFDLGFSASTGSFSGKLTVNDTDDGEAVIHLIGGDSYINFDSGPTPLHVGVDASASGDPFIIADVLFGDSTNRMIMDREGHAEFVGSVTTPEVETSTLTVTSSATFQGGVTHSNVSTVTFSGANVVIDAATLATHAARFDQVEIIKSTTCTTNTSATTTSTTFQNTSLACSITPSATSSKIIVFANGSIRHTAAGFSGNATIDRGGTNLFSSFSNSAGAVARHENSGGSYNMGTMFTLDSPASTSELTYTVQIKTLSGSGTTGWGEQAGQVMMLFEVNGL